MLLNYQNFILNIIKFGLINKLYKEVELLKKSIESTVNKKIKNSFYETCSKLASKLN